MLSDGIIETIGFHSSTLAPRLAQCVRALKSMRCGFVSVNIHVGARAIAAVCGVIARQVSAIFLSVNPLDHRGRWSKTGLLSLPAGSIVSTCCTCSVAASPSNAESRPGGPLHATDSLSKTYHYQKPQRQRSTFDRGAETQQSRSYPYHSHQPIDASRPLHPPSAYGLQSHHSA